MSNKPSYAAVAAPGTVKSSGPSGPPAPSDAPPPYSEPSASHQPHYTIPHQTILPQQAHPALESGVGAGSSGETEQWIQPTAAVAKSRALKRFWLAFFWAWMIWILVGLIIGGGVSDVESNPTGRHGHWDKHGEWHGDSIAIVDYLSAFQRRG
ncbi:hypothetical protein IAR55_006938 [Kwoniella newhampshirensis]|uniref:Uncharacterized protein n=1 Tax=Kwoniella newhampshirensis TaxID=1651941 RepID=A0AAW0YTU1_9TREE